MLSRFHLIPERHGRTDRQTDAWTALLKRRISMKNCPILMKFSSQKRIPILMTVIHQTSKFSTFKAA